MNVTNILLGAAVLYGIFLLVGFLTEKEKSRIHYLEKMVKILDGRLEPITSALNSYELMFVFEGVRFAFIDLEEVSAKRPSFKGFLKTQTACSLTLEFFERNRSQIRGTVVKASEIADEGVDVGTVKIPKPLEEFAIHTNSPQKVNLLFADEGILKLFSGFKTIERHGRPIMSLEIKAGTIVLEFHSNRSIKPHLSELREEPYAIEEYTRKLLPLIKKLELLAQQDRERV